VAGLALGSVVGLALGLAFALAEDIAKPRADNASPLSPLTSWRSDRAHGSTAALASGLAYGILVGLMTGTPDGLGTGGLWTGVTAGLGTALGTVLGGTLILPRTWPASLTFAQLAARRHTPVHLMLFLEDARDRNVLRTIGPVYQFRHARLQDRLAETSLAPGGICQWAGGTNSGWSSRRSQVPSGCLRATCARAPAPSFGGVEVRAMPSLISVASGGSCSKCGAFASTFSHNPRMASRPAVWRPGG
jgi:hypothetical protein